MLARFQPLRCRKRTIEHRQVLMATQGSSDSSGVTIRFSKHAAMFVLHDGSRMRMSQRAMQQSRLLQEVRWVAQPDPRHVVFFLCTILQYFPCRFTDQTNVHGCIVMPVVSVFPALDNLLHASRVKRSLATTQNIVYSCWYYLRFLHTSQKTVLVLLP